MLLIRAKLNWPHLCAENIFIYTWVVKDQFTCSCNKSMMVTVAYYELCKMHFSNLLHRECKVSLHNWQQTKVLTHQKIWPEHSRDPLTEQCSSWSWGIQKYCIWCCTTTCSRWSFASQCSMSHGNCWLLRSWLVTCLPASVHPWSGSQQWFGSALNISIKEEKGCELLSSVWHVAANKGSWPECILWICKNKECF